jgi:hypothetical protein
MGMHLRACSQAQPNSNYKVGRLTCQIDFDAGFGQKLTPIDSGSRRQYYGTGMLHTA